MRNTRKTHISVWVRERFPGTDLQPTYFIQIYPIEEWDRPVQLTFHLQHVFEIHWDWQDEWQLGKAVDTRSKLLPLARTQYMLGPGETIE